MTSLSVAQSQLQAAINERENWKQKAEHLDDVCETMQLVNRLKWPVSLSTLLLLYLYCPVFKNQCLRRKTCIKGMQKR